MYNVQTEKYKKYILRCLFDVFFMDWLAPISFLNICLDYRKRKTLQATTESADR